MKTTRTRARFAADGNEVTLTAANSWGEIETTTYFVPWEGGYVRTRDSGNPEVCEYLGAVGQTLWATPDTLIDVIRREYRLRTSREYRARRRSER